MIGKGWSFPLSECVRAQEYILEFFGLVSGLFTRIPQYCRHPNIIEGFTGVMAT